MLSIETYSLVTFETNFYKSFYLTVFRTQTFLYDEIKNKLLFEDLIYSISKEEQIAFDKKWCDYLVLVFFRIERSKRHNYTELSVLLIIFSTVENERIHCKRYDFWHLSTTSHRVSDFYRFFPRISWELRKPKVLYIALAGFRYMTSQTYALSVIVFVNLRHSTRIVW